MKPITVLQVTLSLGVGGLERVVVNLVNHCSGLVHYTICCLEDVGPFGALITRPNTTTVALGKKPGLDWKLVWKIARIIRSQKIQVVHTHNAAAHLYGSLAARLAGAKVLHTEHTGKEFEPTSSIRANRIAARFTDLTVAVSERNAKFIVEHEGVPPSKIEVLPNGIPLEQYQQTVDRAAIKRQLGLPDGINVIGAVGRLVAVKNYPLLLRTFISIAPQYPNTHLVIVGDGPMRTELESFGVVASPAQPGQPARVHFLGQRNEVADLLNCFDVFVLCSHSEGHSIALLEAMATGCPIVATAVGGNVELIQHDVTGLIVPSNDEQALGSAITQLLNDSEMARRLGQSARRFVQEHYSVQQMVRQYENLYCRLVSEP